MTAMYEHKARDVLCAVSDFPRNTRNINFQFQFVSQKLLTLLKYMNLTRSSIIWN